MYFSNVSRNTRLEEKKEEITFCEIIKEFYKLHDFRFKVCDLFKYSKYDRNSTFLTKKS